MREKLELQEALSCSWLASKAAEAIAVVAAQHEHTHANGHANGHTNGHSPDGAREKLAAGLALSTEDVLRAHKELKITPQQVCSRLAIWPLSPREWLRLALVSYSCSLTTCALDHLACEHLCLQPTCSAKWMCCSAICVSAAAAEASRLACRIAQHAYSHALQSCAACLCRSDWFGRACLLSSQALRLAPASQRSDS